MTTGVIWMDILSILIGAGLLKYIYDGLQWVARRASASSPAALSSAHLTTADQSLAVVAKARDELEDDNARLRAQLVDERARHDHLLQLERERYESDREAWQADRERMRREITALEERLRQLLAEVEAFKLEHIEGGDYCGRPSQT